MEETAQSPEQIISQPESGVPPEILPTPAKPKPWLKIFLFSILGVLVVSVLVFGAYKLGQKQVQPALGPTPTSVAVATPTPDPTANWKTYTNTKYRYEIKYPLSFKYSEWKPSGTLRHSVSFISEEFKEGELPQLQPPEVGIGVYDDEGLSLRDWLDEHSTTKVFGSSQDPSIYFWGVDDVKPTISAGKEGLGFSGEAMGVKINWIVTKNNSNVIVLHRSGDLKDTFNLMLSTFKFLPSVGSTSSP